MGDASCASAGLIHALIPAGGEASQPSQRARCGDRSAALLISTTEATPDLHALGRPVGPGDSLPAPDTRCSSLLLLLLCLPTLCYRPPPTTLPSLVSCCTPARAPSPTPCRDTPITPAASLADSGTVCADVQKGLPEASLAVIAAGFP